MRLDAFCQRLGVRVQAREGRQKRRMNIDQATSVVRNESRGQDTHKACQQDIVGRIRVDFLSQGLIKRLTRGKVRVGYDACRDTLCLCPDDSGSLRATRQDSHNLASAAARLARLDDRLHV